MIPLRDATRSRTTPYINYLLILTCILVFIYQLQGDEKVIFQKFGAIPADVGFLGSGGAIEIRPILSLFTSLFLHGGWLHLIGNMLYLFVFGDNVEDRIGHGGYLLFYLVCGIGATLTEVYFHQTSTIPIIGASGAIAGVLGAYLVMFPRARILTIIPLVIIFPIVEVSAFFFLGLWFLMQFVQGVLSVGSAAGGGIAWWAHAGGFLIGAILLPFFRVIRKIS